MPDDPLAQVDAASRSDFRAAFEAGFAAAETRIAPDGSPYVVAPVGAVVHHLERMMPAPPRIRRCVRLDNAASFVEYISEFRGPGTTVFAALNERTITAVLDYDEPGAPAWGEHVAWLKLQHSPEWLEWTKRNRQVIRQADFAEFIEDQLRYIVQPDGAALMEMVTQLEAKRSVAFRSGVNLQNGSVQLQYEETEEPRKGNIIMPRSIVIGPRVFLGDRQVRVDVRLRYRITNEGALTFQYVLDEPEHIVEDAFAAVVGQVAEACDLVVLSGTVP